MMLKQLLSSNDNITAADIARVVDPFFKEECLSNTLCGVTCPDAFLFNFYKRVVIFAMHIPYTDLKQDKLVQVLQELEKVPTSPSMQWRVSNIPWHCSQLGLSANVTLGKSCQLAERATIR